MGRDGRIRGSEVPKSVLKKKSMFGHLEVPVTAQKTFWKGVLGGAHGNLPLRISDSAESPKLNLGVAHSIRVYTDCLGNVPAYAR